MYIKYIHTCIYTLNPVKAIIGTAQWAIKTWSLKAGSHNETWEQLQNSIKITLSIAFQGISVELQLQLHLQEQLQLQLLSNFIDLNYN